MTRGIDFMTHSRVTDCSLENTVGRPSPHPCLAHVNYLGPLASSTSGPTLAASPHSLRPTGSADALFCAPLQASD